MKEEFKKYLEYVWPQCPCGCGKQSYGWWGNKVFTYKVMKDFLRGRDRDEAKQTFLRNTIRQRNEN